MHPASVGSNVSQNEDCLVAKSNELARKMFMVLIFQHAKVGNIVATNIVGGIFQNL